MRYGGGLRRDPDVSREQVLHWTKVVAELIRAALGEGEELLWFELLGQQAPGLPERGANQEWVARCNLALLELVRRVDSLDVDPDFDFEEWGFDAKLRSLVA